MTTDLSLDNEFETFFRLHKSKLVTHLRVLGADNSSANELAQEAMLETYRNWHRYEIDKPWAYVRKVADFMFFKEAKRKSREILVDTAPDICDTSDDFAVVEAADMVRQVISTLPPRQQEVLFLNCTGYKSSEIASILGLRTQTVTQYLWRANKTVAAVLLKSRNK